MHIAQSKHPSVAEQHTRMRAAEMAVVNAAQANGWKVPEARRSELRERVEELSGGRNTVLYSAEGVPGIYVRIDADTTALTGTLATEVNGGQIHPAFVVNGAEKPSYYIGKYQGAVVDHQTGNLLQGPTGAGADRRAMSLPGLDACANIDFDVSRTVCSQNGTGFHLITNAEWAWIYLLTLQWGFEPRGANNNAGRDYVRTDESSRRLNTSAHGRSACGTGPVSWTHDGTPYGAWDLNGSIWEWVGGLRWANGEIQIIPNNDAAGGADQSAGSTAWRAILEDGSLVNPGETGTLKHDATQPIQLATTITTTGNPNTQFNALAVAAGVTVPTIIRALGIHPCTIAPVRGRLYINNGEAERVPRRGGDWSNSSRAGVAALSGVSARSSRSGSFGFRPAFVF